MAVKYTNNASTTLSAAITSSATSLSVASGGGALFPALSGADYFYLTIVDSAGNIEIMKVTARSVDTFTVVRGQDGTTAQAWSGGQRVELRITRAMLDDLKSDAGSGYLPLSGGALTNALNISFAGPSFMTPLTLANTSSGGGQFSVALFAGALGTAVAGDALWANNVGNVIISPNASGKSIRLVGGTWTGTAGITIDGNSNVDLKSGATIGSNTILHAGNYGSYALPLSGGTLTGALVSSSGNPLTFTALGNGTYNIGGFYVTSSLTSLEAPLASDSAGAAQIPLILTWRGGYGDKGGLKLLGAASAELGGNVVLHAGNYSSYAAPASHTHSYLPLSGGTVTGNLYVQGGSSQFPSHFFHYEYDASGNVYEHYYAPGSENAKNSSANLRVASTSGYYKTLFFSGDGTFQWNSNTVLHAGNYSSYAAPASHTHNYMSADYSRPGGDLNSKLIPGNYGISYTEANRPADWGALIVGRSADVVAQWYLDHNNAFWIRGGNPPAAGGGGVWNSWREVLHSGNYTNYAAPASHTHSFDSLTSKTGGTGDYMTTGSFIAQGILRVQNGTADWDSLDFDANGATHIINARGAETGLSFQFDGTERMFLANGGVLSVPAGYVSNGNPWGTSNSAFFPNGVTTNNATNWLYGHNYLGNAPSNGSGAEISSNGRFYNSVSTGTAMHVRRSGSAGAATNAYTALFENSYGDHSWGIVAEFRVGESGGGDRPSILFSNGYNSTTWSVGFGGADDQFRVNQNHGWRNGSWGTERFRIGTDGTPYFNGNVALHAGNYTSYTLPTWNIQGLSSEQGAAVNNTGWYTIATHGGARGYAEFWVYDTDSSRHNFVQLGVVFSFGNGGITVLSSGRHGTSTIRHARLLYNTGNQTYGGAKLQIYCENPSWTIYCRMGNDDKFSAWSEWTIITPVQEDSPSGWAEYTRVEAINDQGVIGGMRLRLGSTDAQLGGNQALHAGNYGSYALPLSGGTMSGRLYQNDWIEFGSFTGLYSPNNSAHFYPNNGSYGSWRVQGTRNGWGGLNFANNNNGDITLMVNPSSNETGFYNPSYGWQFRWMSGSLTVCKNTYGGGTEATVLDSSNYTSYAAPASHSHDWSSITSRPYWMANTNFIDTVGNFNNSRPSGFYQGIAAANAPSSTWYNYINVRHSNTGNDHGFQLAMSYYDEILWSRTYQGGTGNGDGSYTTWRAHLHSGNYTDYVVPKSGGTMTGNLGFSQPVGLTFANGQYIKDNSGGGLAIYSGAAINLTGTYLTYNGQTILTGANISSYAIPLTSGSITTYAYVSFNSGFSASSNAYFSSGVYQTVNGIANTDYSNTVSPSLNSINSIASHTYAGKTHVGLNQTAAKRRAQALAGSGGTFGTTYGYLIDEIYVGSSLNAYTVMQQNSWSFISSYATGSLNRHFYVGAESIGPGSSQYDNLMSAGASSARYTIVYATTGTINTSDVNEKEQIQDLDAAERRVAVAVKGLIKKFKWKDAVAKKGDAARIHIGVIAQEVEAAFVAEGLDPERYALFCKDVWWEKMVPNQNYGREDAPNEPAMVLETFQSEVDGGLRKERKGIRYDQLLAFVISAI